MNCGLHVGNPFGTEGKGKLLAKFAYQYLLVHSSAFDKSSIGHGLIQKYQETHISKARKNNGQEIEDWPDDKTFAAIVET